MLADEAADILAVGSGLTAEAGRIGRETTRQDGPVDDLVAVVIGQGHLGRRHQVPGVILQLEEVLGELGQVARPGQAGLVGDERGQYFGEAPLAGVDVEHEVDEGPFHAGRRAQVYCESRTGDLGGPLEIKDAQVLAEIPVGQRRKIENPRLPHSADLHVFGRILAHRHRVVGQVGDVEERQADLVVVDLELVLDGLDLVAQPLGLGDDSRSVLLFPFQPGHQLRVLVALGPQVVGLDQAILAGFIKAQKLADIQDKTPGGAFFLNEIDVFVDEFGI